MPRYLAVATIVCLLAGPPAVGAQWVVPSAADASAAAQAGSVRRLSVDEAVALALEQNLTLQVERLNPQISDLSIAQAQTAWTPSVSTSFTTSDRDSPANSFLSGAADAISTGNLSTQVNYNQTFEWGGSTTVSWDSSRSTTNNFFSNFNPTVQSNLAFQYSQPLLRNRTIDSARQQLLVSRKNREISDVQLRQTVTNTIRSVKNAYWDLSYAAANLAVVQQSLDLAQRSLRNTRAQVEIGTLAPIDIVEAEFEVAQREEAVIVAEGNIEQTQDQLKSLIMDPASPDFWNVQLELSDVAPFLVQEIDLDGAVRHALDIRTDLEQARKNLESNDISLEYARNQTLPSLDLQVNYGLTGLGGRQLIRGPGGGFSVGPVLDEINVGYGSVLGNLFTNDYPNWTASLTIGYPLGQSSAEASLARARLQYRQAEAQIDSLELQVTLQVRNAARQVNTNARRVETTRVARQASERRLQAEERKFAAGTSTSFFVFQAQRDLAEAQNNELRAILDYNKSLVDFETVQETSLGGGGGGTVTVSTSAAAPSGGSAIQNQQGGF